MIYSTYTMGQKYRAIYYLFQILTSIFYKREMDKKYKWIEKQ